MNNDVLLGFLLAVPLYAMILFLFRDIIIGRFINKLLANSKAEIITHEPEALFSTPEFKEAVENDLITSYKLLLILRDQFEFLKKTIKQKKTAVSDTMCELYDEKIDDLTYTIEKTEQLFDNMGNTEYQDIKNNLEDLLDAKNLF